MQVRRRATRRKSYLQIQRQMKQLSLRQQFFSELILELADFCTEQQHQYLIHFALQSKITPNQQTINPSITNRITRDSIQLSPLASIQDNLFKQFPKTKFRKMLTSVNTLKGSKNKINHMSAPSGLDSVHRSRKNIKLPLKNKQNKQVKIQKNDHDRNYLNMQGKNSKTFRIQRIKRTKLTDFQITETLLKNNTVYHKKFLSDIFETNVENISNQFNQNYLFVNSKESQIPFTQLREKQQTLDQKYQSLAHFSQRGKKYKAEFKTHSRKF